MATGENDNGLRGVLQGIFSGNPEGLKDLVQAFINQLLRAEQAEYLGVGHYERNSERTDYRSGYMPRLLKTRLGTLELMVPQTRGGFVTAAFDRYQRNERALLSGIGEMALKGVSTRKVKDVTEAFFGFEVSAQTVSNISKKLDDELIVWRSRRLTECYPYLIVDARYEKVRVNKRVVSQGVLIVAGVDESGNRRVLDLLLADSESEANWREVFNRLKDRGLHGVKLVVSDDHRGIVSAVERCFQGASWQRCQVHFMRNAMGKVARNERKSIADALKEVFNQRELEKAVACKNELVSALSEKKPGLADWIDSNIGDCLAVYNLPKAHQKRLRTTNMLERLNKEIKRRTKVVEIFPSRESAERLIGALLIDQDEEWLTGMRYLNMEGVDLSTEENKRTTEVIKFAEKT